MSGLIRYITSSFSALDSLLVLCSSLVRSKLEYVSSFGILSLQQILPNLKEFNENLQRFVTPDSLTMQELLNMKTF
jgi:hypothetical protein